MPSPPKKDKQFNVLMSVDDFAMLNDVANKQRISKGQVIRNLIFTAHMMVIRDQPMCVNGRQCAAPQMHPRSLPTPTE